MNFCVSSGVASPRFPIFVVPKLTGGCDSRYWCLTKASEPLESGTDYRLYGVVCQE